MTAHEAPRGSDRELVASCRRGEEHGFRALLEAHQEYVFRLCWRMTGSRQTAMDLTQEVFMRVLRALPDLDPDPSLRPWLRRVTTNLCLNELARSRSHAAWAGGTVGQLDQPAGPVSGADPVGETVVARTEIDRVARFLVHLPPQRRDVLILSVVESLAPSQIARIMGLPVGTVKSHLSRARARMRQALLEEEDHVAGA